MNNQILLMLQLQNQLNESTNGQEWKKGITKNNKIINWNRCIYMECAEMIDSFSWKHWKSIDKEPDWDNMQIEVVDVWHFIMSLAIERFYQNMQGGVEDLALYISELPALQNVIDGSEDFAEEAKVIEVVEDLMRIVLEKDTLNLEQLFEKFFTLVVMSGLNLESLYRLYVGKNILNQFRQDHGYKDGTYIKVWNGEEDNVVMKRIWQEDEAISPDALYKALLKHYITLTQS